MPWAHHHTTGWKNASGISEETLSRLVEHRGVKIKDLGDGLVSANFTRDVFQSRQWDEIVTRARGLFLRGQNVVARSYDKFFNLGERPETEREALRENLEFPVTVYVKENGYLGIVGYDETTDSLVFCSKSTTEGPFAQTLKEAFFRMCAAPEKVREYLRETHSSLVFEVVDPVGDPHIISYGFKDPVLFLLDVVHRSEAFEKAPYLELQHVAERFGFFIKRCGGTLHNVEEFDAWLDQVTAPGYRFGGVEDVEGFVLEDTKGFQTKIKLHFYSFWKRMRSLKDHVLRHRTKGKALRQTELCKVGEKFRQFCLNLPDKELEKDICELRRLFLKGEGPVRKRPKYAALVLTKESKQFLLSQIHPIHRKVFAHHVTLAYGLTDEQCEALASRVDEEVEVILTGYYADDKGQCVSVRVNDESLHMGGQVHHITLSTAVGVPPVYSLELMGNLPSMGHHTVALSTTLQILTGK